MFDQNSVVYHDYTFLEFLSFSILPGNIELNDDFTVPSNIDEEVLSEYGYDKSSNTFTHEFKNKESASVTVTVTVFLKDRLLEFSGNTNFFVYFLEPGIISSLLIRKAKELKNMDKSILLKFTYDNGIKALPNDLDENSLLQFHNDINQRIANICCLHSSVLQIFGLSILESDVKWAEIVKDRLNLIFKLCKMKVDYLDGLDENNKFITICAIQPYIFYYLNNMIFGQEVKSVENGSRGMNMEKLPETCSEYYYRILDLFNKQNNRCKELWAKRIEMIKNSPTDIRRFLVATCFYNIYTIGDTLFIIKDFPGKLGIKEHINSKHLVKCTQKDYKFNKISWFEFDKGKGFDESKLSTTERPEELDKRASVVNDFSFESILNQNIPIHFDVSENRHNIFLSFNNNDLKDQDIIGFGSNYSNEGLNNVIIPLAPFCNGTRMKSIYPVPYNNGKTISSNEDSNSTTLLDLYKYLKGALNEEDEKLLSMINIEDVVLVVWGKLIKTKPRNELYIIAGIHKICLMADSKITLIYLDEFPVNFR